MTHRPLLISFSGLDGSGKSTQIENLRRALERLGHRTRVLAFWDDVVVGTRWREDFVHKVYGSERGVGEPGKPVERRDKNVRKPYLTLARHVLYLLDAIHLGWCVAQNRYNADALIFDRYIYDELANLPLRNRFTRGFVRMIAAIVPRPDAAFVLDADIEAARARKPEYPVDFMRECRVAYMELAQQLGTLEIVPPLTIEGARNVVLSRLLEKTGGISPVAADDVIAPAA
jgi:thymidylate kinase